MGEVLDRQILLYKEVFQISQAQEKAIDEDNEIKLLELIDAKNDLMNKAGELNISSAPYREFWDKNYESISIQIKDELKEKVSCVSELIQKILVYDEKIKQIIEGVQSEKNAQVKQKNNIKKLKSAYGSSPVKDQFIDKSK